MGSPASQRKDIGRSESLRVVSRAHRIFRPSDLIHGEVLGKGCFGQAIKVCHLWGHWQHPSQAESPCRLWAATGVMSLVVSSPPALLWGEDVGDVSWGCPWRWEPATQHLPSAR